MKVDVIAKPLIHSQKEIMPCLPRYYTMLWDLKTLHIAPLATTGTELCSRLKLAKHRKHANIVEENSSFSKGEKRGSCTYLPLAANDVCLNWFSIAFYANNAGILLGPGYRS